MRSLLFGNRTIGGGAPLFIIAEIGTGHGGDLARAGELIEAAADAGADCAKFQMVFAEEIVHPNTGLVPLPGGSTSLYERFRSLERERDFYAELKERTERSGLRFLCTPFGPKSATLLHSLSVDAYKIASPELNYLDLIRQVAGFGRPMILSTGVSTLGDIERAVAASRPDSALLHCVTAYPAPPEDYNLRLLPTLSALFGLPVGVSDHSLDPVLVPALALSVGGSIVEKHICLARTASGLDDPIALPPSDFRGMVEAVRRAEREGSESTIERLSREQGRERVQAVLGDGIKRLGASERSNYGRTNRSLHAVRAIAAGETITHEAVAALRTEKVLRPGLCPELLPVVVGRRAARDIPSGEGIVWDDLLAKPASPFDR